jgi:hypothetical protein
MRKRNFFLPKSNSNYSSKEQKIFQKGIHIYNNKQLISFNKLYGRETLLKNIRFLIVFCFYSKPIKGIGLKVRKKSTAPRRHELETIL